MASQQRYIVFPFVAPLNIAHIGKYKFEIFDWPEKYTPDAVAIAKCMSYLLGEDVGYFAYVTQKPTDNAPLSNSDLYRRLKLLQYVLLVDGCSIYGNLDYGRVIYYSIELSSLMDNPFIFGFRNDGTMIHAIPAEAERIRYGTRFPVRLSKKSLRLLRKALELDDKVYYAIDRYFTANCETPIIDRASQIINLEAAFQCLLDLPVNGTKEQFVDAINSFYDDEYVTRWAANYYDLRSAIHHGYRFKDPANRKKKGLYIQQQDFHWIHPEAGEPTIDLLSIGIRVFNDILYYKYLGGAINRRIIKDKLHPNAIIYGEILEELESRNTFTRKFISLANSVKHGDFSGSIDIINRIINMCLKRLCVIDRSLITILSSVESVEIKNGIVPNYLSDFDQILRKTELLKDYVSVPRYISESFKPQYVAVIRAIINLFRHFALTGIRKQTLRKANIG